MGGEGLKWLSVIGHVKPGHDTAFFMLGRAVPRAWPNFHPYSDYLYVGPMMEYYRFSCNNNEKSISFLQVLHISGNTCRSSVIYGPHTQLIKNSIMRGIIWTIQDESNTLWAGVRNWHNLFWKISYSSLFNFDGKSVYQYTSESRTTLRNPSSAYQRQQKRELLFFS